MKQRPLVQIAGLLLVFPAIAAAQFTPVQPTATTTFTTGVNPVAIATEDFNGDLIPDLAVANLNDNTVTVLLGNATGGFTAAVAGPVPVGTNPDAIVAVDLNGDGIPDLAVANLNDNTLLVLNGDGTGGFKPAPGGPIKVGSRPSALAFGKFNGRTGLAVANQLDGTVTVLLGDGRGGLVSAAGSPFIVGKQPIAITVANFNGHPGLAVANQLGSNVTVLLGDGAGGFTAAPGSPFAVSASVARGMPPYPVSIAAADFNGDAILDLAVANEGNNTVSILQGMNNGGFALILTGPVAAGSEPVSVVAADFNGDNLPDLGIVDYQSGSVRVLLGNGAFAFTAAVGSPYAVGSLPKAAVVVDFNRDGKPDIAVADEGSNLVTVLQNGLSGPVMVSAASGTSPVAPGSIVSIYGVNLATSSATATTLPLPLTLGGAVVNITYVDGSQATLPLFYASPGQINAFLPPAALAGAANISVYTGTKSQSGGVKIAPVSPGLFSVGQSGIGIAIAQLVTPLPNGFQSVTNAFQCAAAPSSCIYTPLDAGSGNSTLVLYGTGISNAPLPNVMVMIGSSLLLPASYANNAGFLGEDQVNVPLPVLKGLGATKVAVVVNGAPSNIVTVFFQ